MKINLLLILLLPFLNLFASSVGNVASPAIIEEGLFISDKAWFNFRLGYENYNVEDLCLKFQDTDNENSFGIHKVKAYANIGSFTINIKERLDAYINFGSMKIEPYIKKHQTLLYKSKSEDGFLFRVGSKLVIFEILDFTLGVDAKYSIFKAKNEYLTLNDSPIEDNKFKYVFNEWQITLGVSQKISILRPYGGIVYRDSNLTFNNTPYYNNNKMKLTFDKKAGAVIGSSASIGTFVLINAELRFINERSASISGELRF
ncbi:MAG: hypothetical protein K1060chlam5_00765 [Candidatus Anoxychlamydiales bacterium]|nr:hypothetical protein [Candidatus Anoxychlamydiales bacterium]